MIEATTQPHLAQAMQRAHQERAKAFALLWRSLRVLLARPRRVLFSRWA